SDAALSGFIRAELQARADARGRSELTREAADAGIGASGLSQVLSGKLGVSYATADRYAKLLGYTSDADLLVAARAWHAKHAREIVGGAATGERYAIMPTVRDA